MSESKKKAVTVNKTEHSKSKLFLPNENRPKWDYKYEYLKEKLALTAASRLKIAQGLLMAAKYDDNLETLEQTCESEGIRPRKWYEWIELDPELKLYHEQILSILGHKREILMARGERSVAVKSYMHNYGDRWRLSDEHHADLKKKVDQAANQDFMQRVEGYVNARDIILKELPSSGMVPPKKTPEEVAGAIKKRTSNAIVGSKREPK